MLQHDTKCYVQRVDLDGFFFSNIKEVFKKFARVQEFEFSIGLCNLDSPLHLNKTDYLKDL